MTIPEPPPANDGREVEPKSGGSQSGKEQTDRRQDPVSASVVEEAQVVNVFDPLVVTLGHRKDLSGLAVDLDLVVGPLADDLEDVGFWPIVNAVDVLDGCELRNAEGEHGSEDDFQLDDGGSGLNSFGGDLRWSHPGHLPFDG